MSGQLVWVVLSYEGSIEGIYTNEVLANKVAEGVEKSGAPRVKVRQYTLNA